MSNSFFHSTATDDAIDLVNKAKSSPILVWVNERALEAKIVLHTSVHLGKPRSIQVLVRSGQNKIDQGKINLRACSAGLRLHTADATFVTGEGSIIDKSLAGSIGFGALDTQSKLSIRIPYGLESDLTEIKVKGEIFYTVNGKEYQYHCHAELPTQLPLSVNVQDSFQERILFSSFKIDTASSIPARISEYSIQDTEFFRVTLPPLSDGTLMVVARQPLSLVAKIKRNKMGIQKDRVSKSNDDVLMLHIRYACLDQEIETAVDDALSLALRKSKHRNLSRLLVGTFMRVFRSKLSTQELEAISLLHEFYIGPFQPDIWNAVLDGLQPDTRPELTSWLRKWHEVCIVPQEPPRVTDDK